MKILVTGSDGQLGRELRRELEVRAPGITIYTDRQSLDITDAQAVEDFMRRGDFTHVVNCAAYTAVDRAEEEKKECMAVNAEGVSNLARHADPTSYKIMHISTDYVFDGHTWHPYSEADKPNPLSVYGVAKRRGETALIGLAPESMIIRTGWLHSPHGHNFVKTILNLGRKGTHLRVVADQIGTPTYASDLAKAIADILLSGHWTPGIFHYSNEGVASWYDVAVAALEYAGMPDRAAAVEPIPSSDYLQAAERPHYAVLDKSKIKATFGLNIPHWQSSLRKCIDRVLNRSTQATNHPCQP